MKQRILTGWNLRRGLYVAVGTLVIIQSVLLSQWIAILFGIYFLSMGLFSFGCAAGNCVADNSDKEALPDGNKEFQKTIKEQT